MEGRALGKGLSALIPEKTNLEKSEKVSFLKVSSIKGNSLQPRSNYDEAKLNELKASIKEKGVLQPILVREVSEGYEVVAGERRLRAVRSLDISEVPVIIKNVTDQEALIIALVENIQREELNPIEEAEAYKKLIEDFHYTQESVAQSVGKDRSTITNTLRLLKLPAEIVKSVIENVISFGHARTLLSLDSINEQMRLFQLTVKKGFSVRELENQVKIIQEKGGKRREKPLLKVNHEVVSLEEDLQRTLGTKVRIVSQKKRGKIVIEYYSPDDLDRIMQLIKR